MPRTTNQAIAYHYCRTLHPRTDRLMARLQMCDYRRQILLDMVDDTVESIRQLTIAQRDYSRAKSALRQHRATMAWIERNII